LLSNVLANAEANMAFTHFLFALGEKSTRGRELGLESKKKVAILLGTIRLRMQSKRKNEIRDRIYFERNFRSIFFWFV